MKLAFSKGINYLYVGGANLRSALADLFTLKSVIIYGAAAILLNIAAWFLTVLLQRSLGEDLAVLHYNVTFGIDRIGQASSLYALPLSGLAILLLNALLASFVRQKQDRLLIHILLAAAVLGNGVVLIGLYSAYIVNFS